MKIFMADTQEKGKARQREIAREGEKGRGREGEGVQSGVRKLEENLRTAKWQKVNK